MNKAIILWLSISLSWAGLAFSQSFTGKPQYKIEVHRADTIMGSIVVELFPAIAPNSVRNWDSLVAIQFYDSIAFHRIVPGFVIQGGDPNTRSGPEDTWGYGDPSQTPVDAEFSAVSHRRGILSAARTNDPNSATSQFFICLANDSQLDRKYSVYGQVVSGMDVVDSIAKAKRDVNDRPLVKITMFVTKIGSNDSITAIPTQVAPANTAVTGSSSSVPLRWNHVPDAMMYHLQLSTDSLFSTLLLDSTLNRYDTVLTAKKLTGGRTYFWRVNANNGGTQSTYSSTWSFSIATSSVSISQQPPIDLAAEQIETSLRINFSLPSAKVITLSVYDLLGRELNKLIDNELSTSGDHTFTIGHLPKGIYFCILTADNDRRCCKVVIE